MIKQLFHKLPIKPKFLRKKFSNKLAKINIIETQAQELKTTNTAIKVLTKAMMFYTKYHPDAKELEIFEEQLKEYTELIEKFMDSQNSNK